jgi:hypothetical protein
MDVLAMSCTWIPSIKHPIIITLFVIFPLFILTQILVILPPQNMPQIPPTIQLNKPIPLDNLHIKQNLPNTNNIIPIFIFLQHITQYLIRYLMNIYLIPICYTLVMHQLCNNIIFSIYFYYTT